MQPSKRSIEQSRRCLKAKRKHDISLKVLGWSREGACTARAYFADQRSALDQGRLPGPSGRISGTKLLDDIDVRPSVMDGLAGFGHRFTFVPISDERAIVVTGEAWEIRRSGRIRVVGPAFFTIHNWAFWRADALSSAGLLCARFPASHRAPHRAHRWWTCGEH